MKDAVVLAVAIVGVVYLLSMETIGANARMALAEPFNGNSAAVLTMVIAVIGSVTGWNRGKAVPAARKVNGLPSVDPKRLKQHDVFNLVVLPILMVLNLGVWLSLVDAYVYTILFSCYMASDAVYIWTYPEAVPQPSLVLAHHSFVLALLSHPLRIPANAIFTAVRTLLNLRAFAATFLHMGLVLAAAATWRVIRGTCCVFQNVAVVEVNTIILVGRRHFARWLGEDTACRKAFRSVAAAPDRERNLAVSHVANAADLTLAPMAEHSTSWFIGRRTSSFDLAYTHGWCMLRGTPCRSRCASGFSS